jgi:D-alanine-D-alanine ligase
MRLGVIFGGRSLEHEVSVVSAIAVLREANQGRFEAVPFGVTKEGRWLTPRESQARLNTREAPFQKTMHGDVPPLLERGEVLDELRMIDAAFPLIHGVYGEDGTLQGMLELFGIPYAGCGVEASAIGMDKAVQKQLFADAGIRIAKHTVVFEDEWERDAGGVAAVIERMGYPAFAKPANGGSSVGVSKVRSREDLAEALRIAFDMDRKAVIEETVAGREVECGVLGNEDVDASPVGEVIPAGEFYDYAAKYLENSARLIAPAEIAAAEAEKVRERAVAAFKAIDGEGYARVDFFLPEDGEPVINEINTLPGFTPISMFPRLWALAGVSYNELITRIVELGLARHVRQLGKDPARAESPRSGAAHEGVGG